MSMFLLLRRHWPPLVMLLVCLPTSFPGSNGPGMLSGHNLLVWGCMILWGYILWCDRTGSVPWRGLATSVLAAVILMTLPLLWTPLPAWRLNALPRLVGLWTGAGLFLILVRTHFGLKDRLVLMAALTAAGMIQALMALLQQIFPLSLFVRNILRYDVLAAQGRMLGSLGQVNLLGSFLAVSAGAALWWLIFVPIRRRSLYLCGWLALTLIMTALIVASSRTGWLGAVLACGGVLWKAYRPRPWLILTGCILLSGSLALIVVHCQPQVRVSAVSPSISAPGKEIFSLDRMRSESRDRRLQMLWVSAALIMQHPLAGSGLGSFERRWSEGLIALDKISATPERVIYPHNELLYVWVEGGVVALAGLMLACVLWFLPVLPSRALCKRGRAESCYAGIWPLTLPLVLHSLTEFPFYLSALHFMLFLLLLRMALPAKRMSAQAKCAVRAWFVAPFCVTGLAVLAICGVNLSQLRTLEQGGFIRPPTLILPAISAVMQSDRLQFDHAVSLLIAYNRFQNTRLLREFVLVADRYLSAHDDPNLMDSLIRVDTAIGQPDGAAMMLRRARVSFPNDPRFYPEGARP